MARWVDVLGLVDVEQGTDDQGFPAEVKTEREVFANKKSVRSSEFYQSRQAGYTVDVMFDIRSIEYKGEVELKHKSRNHDIIRVYDKGEHTELMCQRRDDDGS